MAQGQSPGARESTGEGACRTVPQVALEQVQHQVEIVLADGLDNQILHAGDLRHARRLLEGQAAVVGVPGLQLGLARDGVAVAGAVDRPAGGVAQPCCEPPEGINPL